MLKRLFISFVLSWNTAILYSVVVVFEIAVRAAFHAQCLLDRCWCVIRHRMLRYTILQYF